MKRKYLEEGELYLVKGGLVGRLYKKGLLQHKMLFESNGHEWQKDVYSEDIVMTAGEYYNRLRRSYGEEY